MVKYKEYLKEHFKGKAVHFKCDCLLGLDARGVIVDFEMMGSEIVYILKTKDGKFLKIGENTPSLHIEFL